LFGFAVVRAVRVPLTYDEAATFFRFISTHPLTIFDFDVSTNHFLNTLLTKISYLVFGDSELALRLPNLAGYALYLYFSALVVRRLSSRAVGLGAFVLLNVNPYLVDYFALSRGYGLSLGLLMGAMHFFFSFLAAVRTPDAGRHLTRSLAFLAAAVMANLTLIDVYAALLAVAFAAFVVVNVVARRAGVVVDDPKPRREAIAWLPVVAAAFTLLVLSQDVALSRGLYEPVTVRLTGLTEAELAKTTVQRVDIIGRPTALNHHAGSPVWTLVDRANMKNVRIETPVSAAGKIASREARIEVVVGAHPFTSDRPDGADWASRDAGPVRVLDSGPTLSLARSRMPTFQSIINWRGDGTYLWTLLGYTAVVLAILGALAFLLKLAGALAVRRRILRREQWQPLSAGVLWLAALAGTPMYQLIRESALYYGGTAGLIDDTVYSLINSSFYGRTYHAAQNHVVFAVILATLIAFGVVFLLAYRRGTARPLVPAVCTLAIILMVAGVEVIARVLFDTPYLLDRTALFLVPLFVLFTSFLLDHIAGFGRAGRSIAATVVAAAAVFSVQHFAATANVSSTRDWPTDASTKVMLADVELIVEAEQRTGSRVVLGVDWMFGPVAMFYARKSRLAVIDVVPWPRGEDFLYLEDRQPDPGLKVVKRYPTARSLLARLR
jgi:hypothetical protein